MRNIYIAFMAALLLSGSGAFAQVSNYTFTLAGGDYVSLGSGATLLADTMVEGYLCADTAIGFAFVFGGIPYTHFQESTNGYITFAGGVMDPYYNNINCLTTSVNRPLIAPWYDDEETGQHSSGVYKKLTGSPPNRVLTVEWRNMRWWWSSGEDSVISYEVKLYETSNRIEFVYSLGPNYHPAIYPNIQSVGATVGLADATSFLSVIDTGNNARVSSVQESDTIGYAPATGTIYRFDPPAATGVTEVTGQQIQIATIDAQGLFKASNLQPEDMLQVYDLSGRLIKTITATDEAAYINLHNTPAGMYLLNVSNNEHSLQTLKLVKY